ncbi:hypothetical protein ACM2W4_09070 [Enterococcus casseliflavus]|nr:hypothetical protein [Enterococcus casseliflavus]MCD5201011.1 hypothetical protein [Enterococcus casseliflavus]WRO93167.1 hypothetical protein U8771_09215 [Enterococcus casseliflavus]
MKKWLIVFGTTFTAGMLLILAIGMLGQSLRGDVPEEVVEAADVEEVSKSDETDVTAESEVEEDVQEEEPDPVDDPSLVWKYEGIENTVDPSEVRINISPIRVHVKDTLRLWVLSDAYLNADVTIYADGQQVGFIYAVDRFLDTPMAITTSHIEEGLHSVEVVQYEDPYEPKQEEIIFYVRTTYEIK